MQCCRGFHLTAKHVIHTVGPVYEDAETSAPLLEAAHRSCMRLANEHVSFLAFPHTKCDAIVRRSQLHQGTPAVLGRA